MDGADSDMVGAPVVAKVDRSSPACSTRSLWMSRMSYPLPVASPQMNAHRAADRIKESNPEVIGRMNEFTRSTFRTRGGRTGSGMGLLLEGLWGYHMSAVLEPSGIEIAWIADDQYNDYACVDMSTDWEPSTKFGELLRIEAKSMNLGAVEQKGHFAELASNIGDEDLLLVLAWRWSPADPKEIRVWPKVENVFLDRAVPLAILRDQLHRARGGTFVDRVSCPDRCVPKLCQHHGEPLSSTGKRERIQGPENTRPSAKVQFAANFGGLKRMLATRGTVAKSMRIDICRNSPEAANFVEFMEKVVD